jgi:hypothetical protein
MADRPNINPTPKQEFQQNQAWLQMHNEMIQQPMLAVSLQFALLQMQRAMCDAKTGDGNQAAQNHFKMQGATEFVAIFKAMGQMPELPPTKLDPRKLNQ